MLKMLNPAKEPKAGLLNSYEIAQIILEKFYLVPKTWKDLFLFFLKRLLQRLTIIIVDSYYNPLEPEVLEDERLKALANIQYYPELFDCDDYACYAKTIIAMRNLEDKKNYAFGQVYIISKKEGWGHALNFFITSNNNLYLYEPQNCKIYNFNPDEYDVYMVLI